ncbi:MAG: hypothetical protein QM756_34745 [Polyangiaceae bacterium]
MQRGFRLLAFACASTWSLGAHAAVSTCLDVQAEPSDLAGFEKLVRSELARHPSHTLTTKDCDSRLSVELFSVSKSPLSHAAHRRRSTDALRARERARAGAAAQ